MILCVTMNASIDRRYTMDGFEKGRVNRVSACSLTPGGKGLNVARVLHKLGVPVLATGMLAGYHGAWIESALDEAGIAHDFLHVQGETRICINVVESNGVQTELLEPGPMIGEEQEKAFLQKLISLLPKVSLAVFSGSLPKGSSADLYARLIDCCHKHGVRVLLDTSGVPLEKGIQARPELIKPNEDEIAALLGSELPETAEALSAAAKRLVARGIENVVISLGGRGAMMACAQGVLHALPPKVRVANTTGCGDSMIAGLAAAMLRGDSPEKAMAFATAVAASNASSMETGHVEADDLPALLDETRIVWL